MPLTQRNVTKLLILVVFAFLTTTVVVNGNPFQCKIPPKPEGRKRIRKHDIVYKGYVIIDNNFFALVEIDQKDYEVQAGDEIKGYKIIAVSKGDLRYSFKEKTYRSKPKFQ